MQGFTQETTVTSSRILLLLILLFFGYVIKKNKTKIDTITKNTFLFGGYLSIVTLFDLGLNANGLSNIFSVFLWIIVFRQISCMIIDDRHLYIVALIMSFMCNVLSFIYIFNLASQILYMEHLTGIAAINSIYYIFISFPFVFLFRNWLLSIIFSIFPFYAFITSGKTTCILCGGVILLYYIIQKVKNNKLSSRVLLLLVLVFLFGVLISFIDLNSIIDNTQSDFNSGGNGRFSIYSKVWNLLIYESSVFSILFGHGVDAISRTIGIGGHNDFLEILYCYGIIGLFLFIVFLSNMVKAVKTLKTHVTRMSYIISLIILFFAFIASKMIATQIGLLPLSIFWGTLFANNKYNKLRRNN